MVDSLYLHEIGNLLKLLNLTLNLVVHLKVSDRRLLLQLVEKVHIYQEIRFCGAFLFLRFGEFVK